MADEIKINSLLTITNGNQKDRFDPGQLSVDQAASGKADSIYSIGSGSEEDITLGGDVTTLGWCVLHNLDATNYVTYGPKDTTMKAWGRLEAGEHAMMRLEPGITIRMQANTAACKVRVLVFED